MIKKTVLFFLSFFDFFYQKKIFNFLKDKKLNNFNLVLDVGAHKGETINIFLKNLKIKKIISFEASPKNFLKLKNNFKKLSRKFKNSEIIIENIALSNEKKKIKFKQLAESSSSTISEIDENSSYYKKKYKILNLFGNKKNYKIINLETLKLSDYLSKHKIGTIDFLKIDTEGTELEIILGLDKNIENVKLIMFEHHFDNMIKKKYTFRIINDYLLRNNFEKIYKSKMPFRKTFEYIYLKKDIH